MARSHIRLRADEFSHESCSWQYPHEFWDGLSTIPLTDEALEEVDWRTRSRPSFPAPPTGLAQDLAPTTPEELARFARHSGPDLRDLRGYRAMAEGSTTKTKTKSKTPYHPAFEQLLNDHAIHSTFKSRKPDLGKILAALAAPRLSPSLSGFSDSAFETFQEADVRAQNEADVNCHVLPVITGGWQNDHPCALKISFANLEPLMDGRIAPAQPDMYYGADSGQLSPSIRNELDRHVVPSADKPLAPNLFLECKGPRGHVAVATRQVRYEWSPRSPRHA